MRFKAEIKPGSHPRDGLEIHLTRGHHTNVIGELSVSNVYAIYQAALRALTQVVKAEENEPE
jgi:hypothetical protein